MNAQVSSNRLRDEQSIRCEDKGDSPWAGGLRTHVIGAGNKKMVIQTEWQRSEHRKRQENKPDSFLRRPDKRHCKQRTDQHDHDHEDGGWRIESNLQFTVLKTVQKSV